MKMCVNGLNDNNRYSMKNAISFRIFGKLKKAKNAIQENRNSLQFCPPYTENAS